jgi:hypothetical protein
MDWIFVEEMKEHKASSSVRECIEGREPEKVRSSTETKRMLSPVSVGEAKCVRRGERKSRNESNIPENFSTGSHSLSSDLLYSLHSLSLSLSQLYRDCLRLSNHVAGKVSCSFNSWLTISNQFVLESQRNSNSKYSEEGVLEESKWIRACQGGSIEGECHQSPHQLSHDGVESQRCQTERTFTEFEFQSGGVPAE